jgi:hypothetical protein
MPPEYRDPASDFEDFAAQRPLGDPATPPELQGPDATPEDLRPIYDRLRADARAWSDTIASDLPLASYIRSLPRRVSQELEESITMSTTRDGPTYSPPTLESTLPASEHGAPPMASSLPGWALSTLAAILVVALLGGALYTLGAGHNRGGTTTAHPTATTALPTPTPTIALPPSGLGWTKAGPSYFYGTVAVAPSEPATLYSCGQQPSANGNPSAPSFLGVSHDGGKTWNTSPIPAYCATLKVSPANPLYVAFEGTICGSASGCAAPPPDSLLAWVYSSTDGGAHWALAKLPPNTVDASQDLHYFFAWAGTTLFVAPDLSFGQQTIPPGTHILAASTNGGPFTWVDQHGLSAKVQGGAQVDLLTAVGDTLYVNFGVNYPNTCAAPPCSGIAKTSDGGATWATFDDTNQGGSLVVIAGGASRDLIATSRSAGAPLRSTDGGVTWAALPTMPGGLGPGTTSTFETPDGTLFGQIGLHPIPTYKLPPGAAAWTLVAPAVNDVGSGDLSAVSWDANGHPLLLWEPALGEGLFAHPA